MLLGDNFFRQYIQKPALVLMGLFIFFGGLSYGLSSYQTMLEQRNHATEFQLRSLLKQVKFLRTQELLFQSYGEKYQSFLREGLVYQQDRVKWTDELLKIKTQLHLFPFNFEFEAERPLNGKDIKHLKIDKNIFYYTKLHLNMGLTSDLDLLKVLDQIKEKITPLFLVRGCDMVASTDALQNPKFEANRALFNAKCTLILFQAKPKRFKLK